MSETMTAYTATGRTSTEPTASLRDRIPGWGVDLHPSDRPSYPREHAVGPAPGVHWEFPERQPERRPRERSIEHAVLPPVFGTTLPPRGFSGAIRRMAYRYSEGRAAHWILLLGADRVDAIESHLRSFATLRPDNPITQTGVRSEFTHHGLSSRLGQKRADLVHQALDPVIVAGPWVVFAAGGYLGARALWSAATRRGADVARRSPDVSPRARRRRSAS
jgi:hypothetical protein